MHMFDVCVPSSPAPAGHNPASEPSKKDDGLYLEEADDTLHLDTLKALNDTPEPPVTIATQGTRFRINPSIYIFQDSLRATCRDSADTLRRMTGSTRRGNGQDTNTIHLPSGRALLTYNNAQDVLHLRFTPPAFRFPGGAGDRRHASPISAVFESIWSEGLAAALHHARRVAIDVSQLWPDLARGQGDVMDDIACLACVLQNNLEVLYLVDYCAGRCNNKGARVGGLVGRDGGLYRKLYGHGCGGGGGTDVSEEVWDRERRREPDVFYGVGKIWREVFELEELGWGERHPGFVFVEAFSEVVRIQQGSLVGEKYQGAVRKEVQFQGIRVLIAEDEGADEVNDSVVLSCGCSRQTNHREEV